MTVKNVQIYKDGLYSANINGEEWLNITPTSRFWQDLKDWEASGNTLPVYTEPLPTHGDLKAHLAKIRWQYEVGGVDAQISGNGTVSIKTDRETQAKIHAAFTFASLDNTYTTDWKMSDGEFVELNAAQISELAFAVGGHVKKAFRSEGLITSRIESGELTTRDLVEQAFDAQVAIP